MKAVLSHCLRFSEKVFLNGDTYVGNFKGIFPHGKGKYTWVDGTVYEGNWEEGKMTGKGQIFWPSGVTYEGDFSGGYLHGFGTFTRPDGSNYRGAWKMNAQHGLGRKEYHYSDVYDGLWKEGVQEGRGRYAWSNGNTYIGNWKDGKMWGRGVMKWVNGDLFDGFWLNGFRHGSGCYRFADGSYYFGTWTKGLKDGHGTYYPAGSKHPSLRRLCSCDKPEGKRKGLLSHSSSLNSVECRVQNPIVKRSFSEKISINGLLRGSSLRSHRTTSLDEGWSLGDSTREFSSCDLPCMLTHSSDGGQHEVEDNASVVFEREYMQGVLIKEWIRKSTGLSYKSKHRRKFYAKEMKKRSFVDIFEGHRSFYLMLNLQLGIRYTVGKITPVPMREVRPSDFGERARIRMYFPRKGSQFTPPHYSVDFYWKDYCPMVFRNLRQLFKLDAAEYMMSICGDDGLRELSSPGKSGSIFYISHDDRFFIKTLRRSELKMYAHARYESWLFELYWDISHSSQATLGFSVADYFGYLQTRWEELTQYKPFNDFPNNGVVESKRLIVGIHINKMAFAAPSGTRTCCQHCSKPGHLIDCCFDLHLELKKQFFGTVGVVVVVAVAGLHLGLAPSSSSFDPMAAIVVGTPTALHGIDMLGCRLASTLIVLNLRISAESGELLPDLSIYQWLVGHLIYLMNTRPDLTFVVSVVSQFMHSPRTSHLDPVYHILCDNKTAIVLSSDSVIHERMKHIKVDIHFIRILLKMLPKYYDHVKDHENTLITKFFGFHQITLTGGRKVRFVVMGNMFWTELRVHRRFDLKGSTHGRITNQDGIDDSTTLKDRDLQFEFHMDKLLRESLFKQLNLDCMFLESQKIIDYSLLLGLHFRAPEQLPGLEPPDALHKHENLHQTDDAISQEFPIPPKGLLLVTHEPSSVSVAPGPHSRGNTLRAFSVGDQEVDLLLPGTARLRVQLGVNMPAQARRKLSQEETDSEDAELYEVYDVVLYLGIIDILQNYNMKKKNRACIQITATRSHVNFFC
ncbi:phosphatidylinositol-4-phosphate 5-kinase family protein [Actinidia rufa]|uniref:1-phosphatidylinositol-4-phosphate 5-kinase n=1 Tax=Actinidia rufa TaxID=165716 RepID=A0A7J0EQ25_9ERIC|nr:phosphatidylinositol-4-phosphate 5-kinase family protein [Actinidia rufa]